MPTRRQFLSASLAVPLASSLSPFARLAAALAPPAGADRLIRTVPLGRLDARPQPPFGVRVGEGLDARLFTDLSSLAPGRLVTPADRFFVRTERPATLQHPDRWTLALTGVSGRAQTVPLVDLEPLARPMGTHLIECAGNADPANFGLMSAADWEGVPIGAVLDRLPSGARHQRVVITGVDDMSHPSRTSVPGASWNFAVDDLERAGAFLATRMNAAALPPDHGSPVRLVVPGWYGCACVKWVTEVAGVPDDAPPTGQMREFAQRTQQNGEPALAREYDPAVVDLAATPIRVEQWRGSRGLFYRVVGIVWGGSRPTGDLSIRFRSGEAWTTVDDCPVPATTTTWSLWSHVWRPPAAGRYQIVLRANDRRIRTRRLDLFYYAREVEITEV